MNDIKKVILLSTNCQIGLNTKTLINCLKIMLMSWD